MSDESAAVVQVGNHVHQAGHRLDQRDRRRAERGMAILIADHRVREALMLCNDALLLADGAVEAAASAADFAEHPAVRERYLG